MLAYIGRRISIALLILFGSTYLTYQLAAYSGDPLAGIRESQDPKKEQIMAELTKFYQLDVPPPARYFLWLQKALGFATGTPDFGTSAIMRLPVIDQIAEAIPVTIRLVTAATILAIVLGITFGVLSAIRQYSRLDYSLTFLSFLLYSLPIFWVAVMLKEYMAIQFNLFLVDPKINLVANGITSALLAVVLAGFVSGTRRRVLITLVSSFAIFMSLFYVLSLTNWFRTPGLGIWGVAFLGLATSVGLTHVFAGLHNRKALYAGIASVAVGVAVYQPFGTIVNETGNFGILMLMGALMLSVSYFVGYFFSKIDKGPIIRSSMLSAFFVALFTVADRAMQAWPEYYRLSDGKPVQVDGSYNIAMKSNDFWVNNLDIVTHLILPTTALTLISFAGYLRYSRASVLEVLGMDYIRTARAKGVPEREVILRHALRNSMIPLTTLIAFDIAGIVGGAIITERVFSWKGMGSLANDAIVSQDLNLLMGTFSITAFLAVMATLAADLIYTALDPRIRIRK
ncbi:MAG: ABC transporter permease [Micrococcales bacterium]|nr:ABC transporter permease [Micrococcales bacterium]NBR77199.1 ABC transporter permease [Microbacteriaceae bacterium]NBX94669.1 ABC transporter permease [Actinomycetota bacterium]NBS60661.1 ABC transporter permease [Microbacteriaceae bacterium]NBS85629.1 ABC transporter permease [Micrococcales bacterium]